MRSPLWVLPASSRLHVDIPLLSMAPLTTFPNFLSLASDEPLYLTGNRHLCPVLTPLSPEVGFLKFLSSVLLTPVQPPPTLLPPPFILSQSNPVCSYIFTRLARNPGSQSTPYLFQTNYVGTLHA